jgi:hypothetical protein
MHDYPTTWLIPHIAAGAAAPWDAHAPPVESAPLQR